MTSELQTKNRHNMNILDNS